MRKCVVGISILAITLIFAGCAKGPTNSPQGYWDEAVALFDSQDFEECISQYQDLVKFYPQDTLAVKALFAMAEIYKNNLKDLNSAIFNYRRITKDYLETRQAPNAKFMIGYIYANDIKDYEKARKSYNEFLKEYPNHVLVPSAQWELENIGKSLDEIQLLESISQKSE